MKSKRRQSWKSVQLPEELIRRVDEIIAIQELGYTSRSEFIKEAVRLRIEEIEKHLHERKRNK